MNVTYVFKNCIIKLSEIEYRYSEGFGRNRFYLVWIRLVIICVILIFVFF